MSQGTISHYSSRNLDACTLQLKRWRPFITPAVAEAAVDLHQPARYTDIEPPMLPATRPLDIKTGGSGVSGSPALHLVKYSFKQVMGRSASGGERFRWACHPFKELPSSMDSFGSNLCESMDVICQQSDCIDMNREIALPAEDVMPPNRCPSSVRVEMIEEFQNVDMNTKSCYEDAPNNQGVDQVKSLNDVDMMAGISPTLGIYRVTGYLSERQHWSSLMWH